MSDDVKRRPAGNGTALDDHTGSTINVADLTALDLTAAALARDVLACLLVNTPEVQAATVHRVPRFRDPLLEWGRQAVLAAVGQGRPMTPAAIVAAADRAKVETPPALLVNGAGYLHDLISEAPDAPFLSGLLEDLAEAELRRAIAAHGRRLTADAHRGSVAEKMAVLEMAGPLIDVCKRVMAVSR